MPWWGPKAAPIDLSGPAHVPQPSQQQAVPHKGPGQPVPQTAAPPKPFPQLPAEPVVLPLAAFIKLSYFLHYFYVFHSLSSIPVLIYWIQFMAIIMSSYFMLHPFNTPKIPGPRFWTHFLNIRAQGIRATSSERPSRLCAWNDQRQRHIEAKNSSSRGIEPKGSTEGSTGSAARQCNHDSPSDWC